MPKRQSKRSRSPSPRTRPGAAQSGERLQKILAAAGVASRRDCEELIREGRVMVDGQIVTKLGSRADLATQEIVVDGQKLKRPKLVYYAVHKPKGVLSTNWDPSGRMRLVDLAPDDKRLFCVGRLDRSSEGLAMLTNDGELAHRIMHPSFGVTKTYVVEVAGSITSKDIDDLLKGVYLSEGRAKTSKVRVKSRRSKSTLLEIELQEGKNREIRRIMAKLDHKVLNLRRIAIGPLRLGDMPAGAYRELTSKELAGLRSASDDAARLDGGAKRKKSPASSKPPATGKPSLPQSHPADDDDYGDDDEVWDVQQWDLDDADWDEGELPEGGQFDEASLGDDFVEVRDHSPTPSRRSGAVIGGGTPSRSAGPAGKSKAARGKSAAGKGPRGRADRGTKGKSRGGPAAKRKNAGKASGKGPAKSARGGRSKRKGSR